MGMAGGGGPFSGGSSGNFGIHVPYLGIHGAPLSDIPLDVCAAHKAELRCDAGWETEHRSQSYADQPGTRIMCHPMPVRVKCEGST